MGDYGRSAHKIKKEIMGPTQKKKNMGSAHILVLGFLGAHNPYTPIHHHYYPSVRIKYFS